MPKTERDEILIKYAENLEPKTAGSWYDFGDELLTEAVVMLGSAAVAPLVALKFPGIAGLMTLGGPWVIALGLSVGAGIALYNMGQATYKNLETLIDRLDALDRSPNNTRLIDGWIAKLNGFVPLIATPPTTTDPKEKAVAGKKQLDAMTQLHAYLVQMQKDFLTTKNSGGFTDGWMNPMDIGQAGDAISGTIQAMTQGLAQLRQEMDKAAKEIIAKVSKESGKDYNEMAKSIKAKWDQVTKQFGKEPKPETNQEKAGYDLAINIINNKATAEDFNTNAQNMVMLNNLLDMALKSKASYSAPISKRALLLGDGRSVTLRGIVEQGKGTTTKTKKPKTARANRLTQAVQVLINKLGSVKIKEDGIYGPRTAAALGKLIEAGDLGQEIKFDVSQHGDIRNSGQKLHTIYNALRDAAASEEQPEQQISQRRPKNPFYEPNPSQEVVVAYLKRMPVWWGREKTNAHDFLKYYFGVSSPKAMYKLIDDVYRPADDAPIPAPAEWIGDWKKLVDYVNNKYRGRMTGRFTI